MSHQKDCYRLGVKSYNSDPSGDRVGPLVGVPKAILRHCDCVAGHVTQQHLSMTARATMSKTALYNSLSDSFSRDGNRQNRSPRSDHTAMIA